MLYIPFEEESRDYNYRSYNCKLLFHTFITEFQNQSFCRSTTSFPSGRFPSFRAERSRRELIPRLVRKFARRELDSIHCSSVNSFSMLFCICDISCCSFRSLSAEDLTMASYICAESSSMFVPADLSVSVAAACKE